MTDSSTLLLYTWKHGYNAFEHTDKKIFFFKTLKFTRNTNMSYGASLKKKREEEALTVMSHSKGYSTG